MSKTLLSGDKFNSNHQTYLKAAIPLLKALKVNDDVKKIFLGDIKQKSGTGATTVDYRVLDNGVFQVTVKGSGALQLFRVVAKDEQTIIDTIASL